MIFAGFCNLPHKVPFRLDQRIHYYRSRCLNCSLIKINPDPIRAIGQLIIGTPTNVEGASLSVYKKGGCADAANLTRTDGLMPTQIDAIWGGISRLENSIVHAFLRPSELV
jgi:hypothetical protein